MPASPSVDGSPAYGTHTGGGALITAGLTTANANDIIVVVSAVEGTTTPNVSSVTGGGLTFTLRSRNNFNPSGGGYVSVEVWSALATTALSAVVFTVNYTATYDDAAVMAFGVSGCNTAVPWDSNVSLPNMTHTAGTPLSFTISTSNPDDLLLMSLGASNNVASYPEPSGWTKVGEVLNAGGALFAWAHVSSQTLSAVVSGATYSSSGTSVTTGGILDALTADVAAGGGVFTVHPFV